MWKNGGERLRLCSRSCAADHARHRAESRAEVALVGRVTDAGEIVVVGGLRRDLCAMMAATRHVGVRMPVVVRALSHLNLGLHARPRDMAHHGSSQRAPNREQHCQQHKEPDAKRFHRC